MPALPLICLLVSQISGSEAFKSEYEELQKIVAKADEKVGSVKRAVQRGCEGGRTVGVGMGGGRLRGTHKEWVGG